MKIWANIGGLAGGKVQPGIAPLVKRWRHSAKPAPAVKCLHHAHYVKKAGGAKGLGVGAR